MTMSDDQLRRLQAEIAQLMGTARRSFAGYLAELLRSFARKVVGADRDRS